MVPELGHFSLILAFALAFALAVVPALGVRRGDALLMELGGSIATGLFVFVALSFGCLAYAFLADDFSVLYVSRNSNSALPEMYKFSAVWGSHEGSFLLWVLVMSGWTMAVALFSQSLPLAMRARVLSVLGTMCIGFIAFILLTSNPFDRQLPIYPADGSDLNPLLQDVGLIVHPPMLYMGYVGFAVPFAFAIAALLSGQLDAAWARWSRPWTNVAWAFLTGGITLGSWWAYYELGWGGWWFWDAVENASFLPWLMGTALIHSLAVSEKRGVFKSWTVLLAIFAFSLSLLGAFLVRSGVLTSVHAFAVDPERGMFILAFLVLVIGGSLTLFAVKVANIQSRVGFGFCSREALLLINNILLAVASAAVLLGTLYPLIYEAISGGAKISVGPPYFNAVFVPIVFVLLVFMAVGPRSRWKITEPRQLIVTHLPALGGAAVFAVAAPLLLGAEFSLAVTIALALAAFVLATLAMDVVDKVRYRGDLAARMASLRRLPPSYYGMLLGHLGIAVAVVGVALTSYYSDERDVRMEPGQSVTLGSYEFKLLSIRRVRGPNYIADEGDVLVLEDGEELMHLKPQKRYYNVASNTMTEADMDPGLFRDLYVALGEPVGDGDAWAVRVHLKPFVRWIWWGGMFVALGAVLAVMDRRYRLARRVARDPKSAPVVASAT